MTFAQIKADVYRRCGFQATPAGDVSTRIAAFVNEVQQDILSEPGMEVLLNDSVTFASVANQAQYGLPPEIDSIKLLRETTNRIRIEPMSLGEYRALYPDPSAVTGTPRRYVDLGYDAVAVEPSDASTLYVVSSSASDVGTAYLEGYISGGIPFSVSVTMTGSTAVAFSPTAVIGVTKFLVDTAAVGTITLREDSGSGTVLATLGVGATYSRYRRIALVPTPASVITYTLDGQRVVTDMVADTDEPVIPSRFHRMLAIGARAKEYEKQNQIQRWQVARGEFVAELKKLKFWLYEQSVGTPNMQGAGISRHTIGDGGTLAQASSSTTSPLAATAGGTGFASYTIGDLLYADTAASLAKLSDVATGKVLKSGGIGVAPLWGQVNLASDVTGSLTVAQGGTGAATLTNHGVLLGQGTSAVVATSAGATGTVLHGVTGADPSFATITEADVTLADVTTLDVSTSKHGLVPKAPNDATKFLDGTGAYSVPQGGLDYCQMQSFST